MAIQIAERMGRIQPSATLAITAKAKELKAAGKDLVSFGAGEPDFDTPAPIKEAAKLAIDRGQTKYTASGGSPEMKKAIIHKFQRDNGLDYSLDEVMAANGGKQILYNVFMASLNAGDEVLIPAPYWVSYVDQVKLADANPILIHCSLENNYLLTADRLREAITPHTKMLILNSPCNPTGVAYKKDELLAIGQVLQDRQDILIVSDDIYEHIVYDDLKFYNLAMLIPDLKERCFLVNGVSKAYSMTGWRIGFCAAPKEMISAMDKIQGQSTSNPCSISQAAAIAALTGTQDCVVDMVKVFSRRRNLVHEMLSSMTGVTVPRPQGAFYVFPDIYEVCQLSAFQDILKKTLAQYPNSSTSSVSNSQVFCSHLLEKYDVAAVPGIAFGNDRAIRLSYALGDEDIKKGLERLGNMVSDLH